MYEMVLKDGEKLRVRSRWEAVFIEDFLERKDLDWKYEPKMFKLPDGRMYIPDFYVEDNNCWIEVKGYDDGRGLEKVNLLRDMGEHIVYADSRVLRNVYGLDLGRKRLGRVKRVMESNTYVI